jgi:hypothetical protein
MDFSCLELHTHMQRWKEAGLWEEQTAEVGEGSYRVPSQSINPRALLSEEFAYLIKELHGCSSLLLGCAGLLRCQHCLHCGVHDLHRICTSQTRIAAVSSSNSTFKQRFRLAYNLALLSMTSE